MSAHRLTSINRGPAMRVKFALEPDRQHIHGMHDAPVFAWCYSRTADFIGDLVNAGRHPRVMIDYSGELLLGLRQMGRCDILDKLLDQN